MAQQQQTVLRVQTNVPSGIEIIGNTTLNISSSNRFNITGSGTELAPYTGVSTSTVTSVRFNVSGGTGTFYYNLNLNAPTGSDTNLYATYRVRFAILDGNGKFKGFGGFREYAQSQIVGDFEVESGDQIFLTWGYAVPVGSRFTIYLVPSNETKLVKFYHMIL